jgi:hypothetical protein
MSHYKALYESFDDTARNPNAVAPREERAARNAATLADLGTGADRARERAALLRRAVEASTPQELEAKAKAEADAVDADNLAAKLEGKLGFAKWCLEQWPFEELVV